MTSIMSFSFTVQNVQLLNIHWFQVELHWLVS